MHKTVSGLLISLQAEWNLRFSKWNWKPLCHVQFFATPWTSRGSWNSPGHNTEVVSCFLLQWTFPTQGSNPGLPHCRRILYQLSHQGSPRMLQWVAIPFSREPFPPRDRTQVSCIVGRFFTNWATRELLWSVFISIHFIYLMIWYISVIFLNLCCLPKTDSLGCVLFIFV